MDKNRLKRHIAQKDLIWQDLFTDLYLAQHDLVRSQLKKRHFSYINCIKQANNTDELCNLWDLADYLDENYDDISQNIENIILLRPACWQIDFVARINDILNVPIKQTLDTEALVSAYCYGMVMLPDEAFEGIIELLDRDYAEIINVLQQKQAVYKRNMFLLLECEHGQLTDSPIQDFTFREILEMYMPKAGINSVLQAYQIASKANGMALSSREYTQLAMAYYSPYFDDEENLARSYVPEGSLVARVREYLHDAKRYWNNVQQQEKTHLLDDNDSYDSQDRLTHNAIYVDEDEKCIIDAKLEENFYANVYILREQSDSLKNSYPDFIMYDNQNLYTVEFVDSFDELPLTQEFSAKVDKAKHDFRQINALLAVENLDSKRRQELEEREKLLAEFLKNCYGIYVL